MLPQTVLARLTAALGKGNVTIDREDLICHSFDATAGIPRALPEAIVTPEHRDHVQAVMEIANQFKIPLYPRGSGTNLSGGTVPLCGGIVLSLLKMNRILEIDAENLTATVQPGVIVQALNDQITPLGLLYPPDPGTVATATFGGTVAECAGGLRGLKYGVTKHYIMGLEVVLPYCPVLRFGGKTVKNVSGYDMTSLFVGSEGTLGVITEITVRLIPAPECRRSLIAVFDDLDRAACTISGIIARKVIPATMEIMDNLTIRSVESYAHVGLPVEAEAVLLLELDGIPQVVEREVATVLEVCNQNGAVEVRLAADDAERDRIWTARRAALPALARVRPTLVLEDATVPRSRVPEMIRACVRIGRQYDIPVAVMGHAGDGNLHPIFLTDANDPAEMERLDKAVGDVFAAALEMGGTLSGEHGIGIAKARFMEREFGRDGVLAMKKIKQALDPNGILNPGKIFAEERG